MVEWGEWGGNGKMEFVTSSTSDIGKNRSIGNSLEEFEEEAMDLTSIINPYSNKHEKLSPNFMDQFMLARVLQATT